MERKHNLVYKITNKVNQNSYIGVHKTDNVADEYMGSGVLIRKAIKKYGIENFNKEILFDFSTYQEALDKEKEIVDDNFLKRSDTYNIRRGGNGGFDYINKNKLQNTKVAEVSRKKWHMSAKAYNFLYHVETMNKYYSNQNVCKICGKSIPYENRKKKTCSKECFRKNVSLKNSQRQVSNETKQKISETFRKKRHHRYCICGKEIKINNKTGLCISCLRNR